MNKGFSHHDHIQKSDEGKSVLEFLSKKYLHSSSKVWAEHILKGEVSLAGRTAVADELIRNGQLLVWNRPPWIEEDTPQEFQIIYEDDALLVVDKPSGLPTIPGGGFLENT